jgi:hypothetical protein
MDVTEGGSLTLFTSRTSLSDYSSEKGEFAFWLQRRFTGSYGEH